MRALGAEVSSDTKALTALVMLAVVGVSCMVLMFQSQPDSEPIMCQCFCELPPEPEAPLP